MLDIVRLPSAIFMKISGWSRPTRAAVILKVRLMLGQPELVHAEPKRASR